jgi:nicotinamidase-related amidase
MSTFKYNRLDKANAAVLLVDHQSGLISLVQDFTPNEFKNNVLALADVAKFFELPTILTTSFENGPNGPLVPELKAMFPDAAYIARPGNINAWDNVGPASRRSRAGTYTHGYGCRITRHS